VVDKSFEQSLSDIDEGEWQCVMHTLASMWHQADSLKGE
jgi:hypothetical protein